MSGPNFLGCDFLLVIAFMDLKVFANSSKVALGVRSFSTLFTRHPPSSPFSHPRLPHHLHQPENLLPPPLLLPLHAQLRTNAPQPGLQKADIAVYRFIIYHVLVLPLVLNFVRCNIVVGPNSNQIVWTLFLQLLLKKCHFAFCNSAFSSLLPSSSLLLSSLLESNTLTERKAKKAAFAALPRL